ncbi:indole-3-glycerol phosphate synthase TrpC [candidate division KSB1 bacterium]
MFLEKILSVKRDEIAAEEKKTPLDVLKNDINISAPSKSIVDAVSVPGMSIIAEIKKASPSKGIIRENFNPGEIAVDYEQNGAAALSVLTEKNFFLGSNSYLTGVRERVAIPVLRKDFIISEYQIYQSKKIGADAVLLIAACLTKNEINELLTTAHSVNLECIVEVHNEDDIKKIEDADCDIIGINNRNLKTFEVTLETSYRLKNLLPKNTVVISESGIKSAEDIKALISAGFNGVLIGEIFMKSPLPGEKLRNLIEDIS